MAQRRLDNKLSHLNQWWPNSLAHIYVYACVMGQQWVNALAPGVWDNNLGWFSNLQLGHSSWNCSWSGETQRWWQVKIGSGNGLVPSGNKPLPELMLTQICCRHMTSFTYNKLTRNSRANESFCAITIPVTIAWQRTAIWMQFSSLWFFFPVFHNMDFSCELNK